MLTRKSIIIYWIFFSVKFFFVCALESIVIWWIFIFLFQEVLLHNRSIWLGNFSRTIKCLLNNLFSELKARKKKLFGIDWEKKILIVLQNMNNFFGIYFFFFSHESAARLLPIDENFVWFYFIFSKIWERSWCNLANQWNFIIKNISNKKAVDTDSKILKICGFLSDVQIGLIRRTTQNSHRIDRNQRKIRIGKTNRTTITSESNFSITYKTRSIFDRKESTSIIVSPIAPTLLTVIYISNCRKCCSFSNCWFNGRTNVILVWNTCPWHFNLEVACKFNNREFVTNRHYFWICHVRAANFQTL